MNISPVHKMLKISRKVDQKISKSCPKDAHNFEKLAPFQNNCQKASLSLLPHSPIQNRKMYTFLCKSMHKWSWIVKSKFCARKTVKSNNSYSATIPSFYHAHIH